MAKILCVGDQLVNIHSGLRLALPGGQALNVAVNCARLGAQAGFIGAIGSGWAARLITDTLSAAGVDYSHSRFFPVSEQLSYYDNFGPGRVRFDYTGWPDLGDPFAEALNSMTGYLGFSEEDLAYIRSFDILHTTNRGNLERRFPQLTAAGVRISYDFSTRHKEPGFLEKCCPHLFLAQLSCGGMSQADTKALLARVHQLGCPFSLGTLGGEGALFYDGHRFYAQPPVPTEAVDTIGAGDGFVSAFLVHFIDAGGLSAGGGAPPIPSALAAAAAYAATVCRIPGALGGGIPLPPEVSPTLVRR